MQSSSPVETLRVNKPFSVCFENCDTIHLPNSKNDVKIVVDALRDISNNQKMKSRNAKQLNDNGKSEYIERLQKQYLQKMHSMDAGKRNSKHGDKRIIYYIDPDNNNILKILSIFFDDHTTR